MNSILLQGATINSKTPVARGPVDNNELLPLRIARRGGLEQRIANTCSYQGVVRASRHPPGRIVGWEAGWMGGLVPRCSGPNLFEVAVVFAVLVLSVPCFFAAPSLVPSFLSLLLCNLTLSFLASAPLQIHCPIVCLCFSAAPWSPLSRGGWRIGVCNTLACVYYSKDSEKHKPNEGALVSVPTKQK